MEKVVGVIGLGIMGGAMSANLVRAGWRVLGFDTDRAKREAAAAQGAEARGGLESVARDAPLLLTSLPSPAAVRATAAALAAMGLPRRVVVETSTLALDDKEAARAALERAGHALLDCPLSGTGAQARVKDLVVYASGDAAEIARLAPFWEGFARQWHDLGAFGNGSRMKFVANHLVAVHNVASAEAMVLGVRAGLDPRQIVEVIGGGAGASRVFQLRAPMMAERRYEPPTMRVATWQKDMQVIGEFARSVGAPVPVFDATAPIYDEAIALGLGGQDTAAVAEVLERRAAAG